MKRLSIRCRLTLWYAASLALLLTLFGIVVLILTQQQLLARTDGGLREELQELSLEVRMARDNQEFADQLRARFLHHDIYDFLVSNQAQTILFASSGITADQAQALAPSQPSKTLEYLNLDLVAGHPTRVARSSVVGPAGEVSIQALTSLTPLHVEMLTLKLVMLVLLPLGVVFAVVGGYFLAARALAPVEQIVRIAESITIANLHQRIAVTNSDDELGHLATTLNSLIARLERAVDEIQQFTADASHELRTPLAVLRSEAEFALRTPRSSEQYVQALSTVVDEATRLGRLADQLLNLSRQDAGLTHVRKETVHLDALLLDVADQLRPVGQSRGIELNASQVAHCQTLGDDILLGQALFNVIDNALKYTPRGGQITLECLSQGQVSLLRIKDTGIGIPKKHLPRVFDRFYRVDPSRQSATGGTGLGLAITRTAIQLHGGEVLIESEVGVGTTLTMTLPGATNGSTLNERT